MSPPSTESYACYLLDTGFLLGLFFDPEDGGNMLLPNVAWLSNDYTALYPRRYSLHNSSITRSSGRNYCLLSLIRHGPYRKHASKNSSIVVCVFAATVTFSPGRRLATIWRYTYKHTDRWQEFMKYAVEMGSGAMIYVPSLMKIG
jgi:hypothetical protein